jgi:hypothetical protein
MFRFKWQGKPAMKGLGSIDAVTIEQARRKAQELRGELNNDRDPRGRRSASGKTFDACAKEFFAGYRAGIAGTKNQSD